MSLDRLSSYFAPSGAPSGAAAGGGPAWGKFVLAGLVLLGLALAWRFTPLAVIAAPTLACLIMFPRPLITLAAVLVFGPWLGFTYAMAGIMVAALVTFYAGRLVRRDTVRRLAGRKLDRLSAAMRARGLLAMTAVRLVPLAPFPVVGLVAGAIRVKLWHYTLGTFIGNLPGVLAATIFADQIAAALEDSAKINWWVVATVVAVFVAGTVAVRRWLGNIGGARPAAVAAAR